MPYCVGCVVHRESLGRLWWHRHYVQSSVIFCIVYLHSRYENFKLLFWLYVYSYVYKTNRKKMADCMASRMKPFIEIFKSLSDHPFKEIAIYKGNLDFLAKFNWQISLKSWSGFSTIPCTCIWLANICMFPHTDRHQIPSLLHAADIRVCRYTCPARFEENCWHDSWCCSWQHVNTYLGPACHSSRLLRWFVFRFGRLFFQLFLHKWLETVAFLPKKK